MASVSNRPGSKIYDQILIIASQPFWLGTLGSQKMPTGNLVTGCTANDNDVGQACWDIKQQMLLHPTVRGGRGSLMGDKSWTESEGGDFNGWVSLGCMW